MKFSEMPYHRPDAEALFGAIDALCDKLDKAKSADEQYACYLELEKHTIEVGTLSSIAYVRNTIDTRDPFYEKERAFFDEISPLLNEKILNFGKKLCTSPYRKELEGKLSPLWFYNMELQLKGFSPEIIPLMQEEAKLEASYQKLYASAQIDFDGKKCTIPQLAAYKQNPDRSVRKAAYEAEGAFFDAHREELDDIYDKLVKNRTQQAKKLGFETYVPLGYIRMGRNCYGPDGVANFRRQVLSDLVPLVDKVKAAQAKRIGLTGDFKFYDDLFTFKDGNAVPQGTPEELLASAKKMYTEMSPETAEFIKVMFDNELFDVLSKEGKAAGGYCSDFPLYGYPFIFSNFNGTSGDVDVLTHEAGHAFAFYTANKEIPLSDLRSPSPEACETHSMSMEFLTSPYHHLFFKNQTAKYELSHAEDALSFIPYGTMVDHFQELVYSKPEMTPDERNAVWASLEKQYRPYIDFAGLPFYGRGAGWQRQLHIYLNPFYYIDYCLAQTVALQFFALFLHDAQNAWEKYLAFVRMGGTKTFVDLVHSAGLLSPLDDGCLKRITETIAAWLSSHQLA